ncbi:SDR family oxidoreductase [Rhizobium sp. YIM 134829]|uniref:SDR family oxidoreductase n=1 Tax=Rhizobium sp. YIM 134829 TaxID=3390453 RepID=UPI00397A1DDE
MTKTWFITGVSSGLGRHMAEQLLARGDRVIGTVRREAAVADLGERYPERFSVAPLELGDASSIRQAVETVWERAGRIDCVVGNAGYGLFGAAGELTDSQIDDQIAINLLGSIQLIRAVLPKLRDQGGGRIVQLSSEGGQIAYPSFSLYHATKWGIEGFIEAVAQEVAPFGIDFLIVEPGPTGTNFGASLVMADPLPSYAATPAHAVRQALTDGSFVLKGDAARTASAMIEAADSPNPPLRLALGSTAYESISKALGARLAALESQKAIAYSADKEMG